MSEEINQQKTHPNVVKAINKFKEKKERHPIGIDLYLTKENEKKALEKWNSLKDKKAFILLCLNNSDEISEIFSKKK